ncbi:bile acid:sodium symporter [Marispirochaeta aestuarii]|uniref:bile acid:sodium symporter family protein n=1 Tax=Marispirochaeta aestuarii TaxID=1963862 RepID=UPI0029C98F8E|nr:bile acid:sodium symporter [Marispirochaeta aestuarii]
MAGLVTGFLFADYASNAAVVLPYALFFIVFVVGTSCTLESFRSVITDPRGFFIALGVIFILMPLIGYLMGFFFHSGTPAYAAGHFLLSVTPVAITSMVWTGIAGGHIALSLALVTVVTLVSGVNIPFQMAFFMGKVVEFDALALTGSLSRTIVIPVILGLALRNRAPKAVVPLRPYFDLVTKLMMLVIITVNGAVVRPYVQGFDWEIIRLFLLVGLHNFLNFFSALAVAALFLGRRHMALPSVVYASSMKNTAAGIVIALNYFGPVVALPVVFSMMMQQFWAGAVYRIMNRLKG